jgi:pimeloyl-ACP methyl ester carboxylesterase
MRARDPDTETVVERDGVPIRYEIHGEGEQMVLLMPPWALTPARVWKAQIPFLARHFGVISFDPRGSGSSGRPTEASAYLAPESSADALAVLDDAAAPRVALVTVGPGAAPALRLAAEHPERIAGLVLITPDPWPQARYATSLGMGELDAYDDWEKFNPAYWSQDFRGFAEWWTRTKVYAVPHSTKQADDAIEWIMQTEPAALTANVIALGANDREEVLELGRRVRCPVLIVYDDERQIAPSDTWTPLAEATRGRLLRIPGANRGGLGRYPVPFNLALRDFIETASEARLDVAEARA